MDAEVLREKEGNQTMGAMRMNGIVIGAQDGPDMNVRACYRSKRDRGRLGCDATPPTDVTSEVDSSFATKVIAALAMKLEPDEMARCLSILREADLITKEEEAAVNEALSPGASEAPAPEMASDAAIMRRRREHYDRGFISYEHLMSPIYRPPSEAEQRRMKEMFPDAFRIKTL